MGETKKKEVSIEEGFEELNSLLNKMESDEIGIEDSFDLYQKGVEMVKLLNEKLDKVEGKLTEVEESE